MRICHFRAQNGPFALNKKSLVQAINIIFIYLLAPFIVQSFKKILTADPELWDAPFLDPKWPICPNENFFIKRVVPFIHAYLRAKNQSQILTY